MMVEAGECKAGECKAVDLLTTWKVAPLIGLPVAEASLSSNPYPNGKSQLLITTGRTLRRMQVHCCQSAVSSSRRLA